ncbi:MAG: multifunctional CCA tRNA nucleotidyl transferase/2'3'-cyclic phosphodiesterase/2'nucleotidase/phosphatase [Gammaproteobacteria bacterium]|nr:multifunctional CCA tRNA nucleotidyl transferase/2'3'-cyclic phosphodiesterase/2'nucleotidase/phosphatase [Gammaproteobacteria bacterium]
MKIYLVGGAIRDRLLGLPVTERDWVVVGTTPEEMLKLGYRPVGKNFPVFLHPKTHEEYALARTERKIAKGYKGFKFYADPGVTLEEDLKRRDLTVNAIAEATDGTLIDPFDGQKDIEQKILRHVSSAFAEDPVRILRIARFAARFGGFSIHATTMQLMQNMVAAGEVAALVPERVWQELYRTLTLPTPERFFTILNDCGALAILFPELILHYKIALKRLKNAAAVTTSATIRFTALVNILDIAALKTLCARAKVPAEFRDLALLVIKYQGNFDNALDLSAEELLTTLEQLDAFRRPKRFADFMLACAAHKKQQYHAQVERFKLAHTKARQVLAAPLLRQGLKGNEIKQEMHRLRVESIKAQ